MMIDCSSRGFFDVPTTAAEWPVCVLGPACAPPPATPTEGVREVVPLPLQVDTSSQCSGRTRLNIDLWC